jgi:hypothetical protein
MKKISSEKFRTYVTIQNIVIITIVTAVTWAHTSWDIAIAAGLTIYMLTPQIKS